MPKVASKRDTRPCRENKKKDTAKCCTHVTPAGQRPPPSPLPLHLVVAIGRSAMSQSSQSYELELQTVGQPTAPPILAGLVAQYQNGTVLMKQPPAPPMDLPGGPSANIEIRMDETTGKRYSVDLLTNESKWIDEGDYLDELMADEELDSVENDLLYEASWHELNCGK